MANETTPTTSEVFPDVDGKTYTNVPPGTRDPVGHNTNVIPETPGIAPDAFPDVDGATYTHVPTTPPKGK